MGLGASGREWSGTGRAVLFLVGALLVVSASPEDLLPKVDGHNRGLLNDSADSNSSKPIPDIAAGSKAPCGRYPYMISLRDEDVIHRCGAVLIHESWALTAAHCLDADAPLATSQILYIGGCNLNDDVKSGEIEISRPRGVFKHPGWTGKLQDGNDIALLWLAVPSTHHPIPLPSAFLEIGNGEMLLALRWGADGNGDLEEADGLAAITNAVCEGPKLWGGAIKNSMLCAFGFTNGQDTCKGDSVGPLLRALRPGGSTAEGLPQGDILLGLTSFGDRESKCGESKKPGVYTKISYHSRWIDTVIESEGQYDKTEFGAMPALAPEPPATKENENATIQGPVGPPAAPPSFPPASPPAAAPAAMVASSTSASPAPTELIRVTGQRKNPSTATTVRKLLSRGASPDACCVTGGGLDGCSVLHVAAANDMENVTSILMSAGANSRARCLNGSTPLHLAAGANAARSVRALLKAGARSGVLDNSGDTPLWVAVKSRAKAALEALVQAGVDVNTQDKEDKTPLHWTAEENAARVAQVLVAAGAMVDARAGGCNTSLYLAAASGAAAVAEVLIDSGADVDARDCKGKAPLHAAASGGNEGVAELLLDAGAAVDATYDYLNTPLHVAAEFGQLEVVRLLLERGADVEARDVNRDRPRDEICESNAECKDREILETLL